MSTPEFTRGTDLFPGGNPVAPVTGDFNADGKQDLAVSGTSGGISVYLGNGDGTFGTKRDLLAGTNPMSLVAADLNGDGRLDLVVANGAAPGSVSVLLGNGDGSFGARTSFPAANNPSCIAAGDFNSDGKIDLVVTNYNGSSFSLLPGLGNGGLGARTDFSTGSYPACAAVGDFNADGRLDVAIASFFDLVSVHMGDGAGHFPNRADLTSVGRPRYVVGGDVNGDGWLDLVASNQYANTASVFRGNGDGTFASPDYLATGVEPAGIVCLDLDVDGRLDLGIVDAASAGLVSVFRGLGGGGFDAKVDYAVGSYPFLAASADFDGDTRPDLVVTDRWGFPAVSILLNTTFMPVPYTYTDFSGTTLNLYAWEGVHTAILSRDRSFSRDTMAHIVAAADISYAFYQQATGYTPCRWKTYRNKATVADVPVSVCGGAGCGAIGCTGIELQNRYFDELYAQVSAANLYSQAMFYEFGRNFWHLGDRLEYKALDVTGTITTGFAVFMRFMAMDSAGVSGAPFRDWSSSEFRSRVEDMVDLYVADQSQTWANTLRAGAPQANNPSGLGATDLFASFVFRLRRDFGGNAFVDRVWKDAASLPAAQTTQDAVDNFFLASCMAADRNLTFLFETEWRWPLSAHAKELASLFSPLVAVPGVRGPGYGLSLVSPNPARGGFRVSYSIPGSTPVPIDLVLIDVAGRRVASIDRRLAEPGTAMVDWNARRGSAGPVPPGVYFLQLRSPLGVRARRVVIVE